MAEKFEDFTKLYPVDKTIRTKLIPVNSSLKNCDMDDFLAECDYMNKGQEKRNYITDDEKRAKDSVRAKALIDKYHKHFINETLKNFQNYDKEFVDKKKKDLKDPNNVSYWDDLLTQYYDVYNTDSTNSANADDVQKSLRERIAEIFKNKEDFKTLFGADLFKGKLETFLGSINTTKEDMELIKSFKSFVTYFSTYNTNRQNMYSADKKATAISYRIVNENLPKFIDNIRIFNKLTSCTTVQKFVLLAEKNFTDQLKVLNTPKIGDIFNISNFCNTLTQEQIEAYNAIICGKVENDTVKGINQFVHEYNQGQKETKLPKLKALYKQILSDRVSISWLPKKFENDQELLSALEKSHSDFHRNIVNKNTLGKLLCKLSEYNSNGIYITQKQISLISKKMFEDRMFIADAIEEYYLEAFRNTQKPKENEEKYAERINKFLSKKNSFSIAEIDKSIAFKISNTDDEKVKGSFKTIGAYYANLETPKGKNIGQGNIFGQISLAYKSIEFLLKNYASKSNEEKLFQDKTSKKLIQDYLEKVLQLIRFVKPLAGKEFGSDKDETFYGEFTPIWEELNKFIPLYNMARNYLSRKPYNEEKIPVFFGHNGTFLNGWPDSKTDKSDNGTQYGGYLFRKKNSIGEYDYFLGISTNSKLFRKKPIDNNVDFMERIDYYQIKSKTIFGKSYIGNYSKDTEILKSAIENFVSSKSLQEEYLFKDNETICAFLKRLKDKDIASYKEILNETHCSKAYNDLKEHILQTLASLNRVKKAQELSKHKEYDLIRIYEEIQSMPSALFSYFKVSMNDIEAAMSASKKRLYLFKISNKDLSYAETSSQGKRKSRGRENLHTMYLKALLDGNKAFDIGSGSIYFRRKTDFGYTKETWEKGHHYAELKDRFSYPIISKRRYTVDHLQFHLSMTINYNADKNCKNINEMVNETIRNGAIEHIIGIDRGERNLLYASVIDLHGNIIEQCSLNIIPNKHNDLGTDYLKLLKERESIRQEERRSWDSIEKINELKTGYVSQAVHQVVKMVLKYHAIIVLEDLNEGFIRSRQKRERTVYAQFEKQLIEKLNYLVDKGIAEGEPGSATNGYQLTNPTNNNVKSNQSGILFYIPAWNTSNIDPTTGFVNLFNLRYQNREKTREFFDKFKSIKYNSEKKWLEFTFDYNDFTSKGKETQTIWTVCTYGPRIEAHKDSPKIWKKKTVEDINNKWLGFFNKWNITISEDLKEQIVKQDKKEFYKHLLDLFKLTLQMRNSDDKDDYIISPVMNTAHKFFKSCKDDTTLPIDADANGAYNIARKGLMWIKQMKDYKDTKKFKPDLKNRKWLNFAQQKPYKDE